MARDDATRERIRQLLEQSDSIDAVAGALIEATAGPGECRIRDGTHDEAYADVHPVLMADGLHWCCSFNHCSEAVIPLSPADQS